MKYEIVANSRPLALEKEINAKISEGWVPQGGLSISDGDKVTVYCQAMIKHNEVRINVRVPKTSIEAKINPRMEDYIK